MGDPSPKTHAPFGRLTRRVILGTIWLISAYLRSFCPSTSTCQDATDNLHGPTSLWPTDASVRARTSRGNRPSIITRGGTNGVTPSRILGAGATTRREDAGPATRGFGVDSSDEPTIQETKRQVCSSGFSVQKERLGSVSTSNAYTSVRLVLVLITILIVSPSVLAQLSYSAPSHYIVFDEIGKMASSMTYIHVMVPLNLTNLFDQAELFQHYLMQLSTSKTKDIQLVPMTKGVNDVAHVMLAKLARTMLRLAHINDILPNLDTLVRQKRQLPDDIKHILRTDRFERDITDVILDQLKREVAQTKHAIDQLRPPTTTLPPYPEHYWQAYYNPNPNTTVFDTPPPRFPHEPEFTYWSRLHYFYTTQYNNLKYPANNTSTDNDNTQRTKRQTHDDSTTDYIEMNNLLRRQKRFLLAAGVAIGILGTFMGIYSQFQISELQRQIADTNKKHNMLVQVTDRHEVMLTKITKNMEQFLNLIKLMQEYNPGLIYAHLNEHMEGFLDRIRVIEGTIQQLQHRRLSIDLLTTDQLTKLHQSVLDVAKREGYEVLPERLGDYFQIEVSYIRKNTDVDIIIHVPCITPNSLLTIYKYVSFPFPLPKTKFRSDISITETLTAHSLSLSEAMGLFDNTTSYSHTTNALYVTQDQSMIAIGRDHRFRMSSQSDLASCIQRNHVYLCDKHQVVRTDLLSTCLGSLYLRDADGVRTHCRFEVRPMTETVYQLNNLDHLVFSPQSLTAQMTCKNGSLYPVFLNKASRITVPQGCELTLRAHQITSDTQINIAPPPLQYEWHWDPEAMPSHLLEGSAHLDQQIQALREHLYNASQLTVHKTDFSRLLTDEISTPNTFLSLFWPFLLVLFPVLLGALVFGWCYKRRKHRRETNRRNGAPNGQPMIVIQPSDNRAPPYDPHHNQCAGNTEHEVARLNRK